ncbi:ecto-ADP-ribosyltransferase 5-like [Heterodontus francisci]|uniref:ecto-ADP-ribosyltransferase 5-like n=1 Tax=Heterodontus francisci TaxID=7792 RepID=UPI00355C7771
MQLLVSIVHLYLYLQNQGTLALKHDDKGIKLDMAYNSAAYIFTQSPAADQAAIDYIRKEWAGRVEFLKVWDNANRSLARNCIIPRGLRKEHLMAIHAYTQESRLYQEFNAATRKYGRSDAIYQKSFHFKSFHYLLSVALDKLKKERQMTFRGVQLLFNATARDKVRLGQFSSTSMDQQVAMGFMKENSMDNTLFQIKTKWGVSISQFSKIRSQKEILIPPIEVFMVKNKPKWEKKGNKSWVEIKLHAKGCQGITVTVETRNGVLEVKRGKGMCPKHCLCFPY